MSKVIFLASPELWEHGHGPMHPLKPERLKRTYELMDECGMFAAPDVRVIPPRQAIDEELGLFHTQDYIWAVKSLSRGETVVSSRRYNFDPGDNPVFTGMYESEALKVGSALLGAELILKGECDVAFSYGGGLHHGGAAFASGFCVFNDVVVVINWLVDQGLRVAYVDIDVHHADGVQAAFYDSNRVLTISLHQDGRTLFPGTGSVDEVGIGKGKGFCVNIPLPPFTDDEAYLLAFRQVVPSLVSCFSPDILVTQLGVDTHYLDPLGNLALTTYGHQAIFKEFSRLSGRWLALGGGGYNLDVVPRSWTLALGVMAGLELPVELPVGYCTKYGGSLLHDAHGPDLDLLIREKTTKVVAETIQRVKELHHYK